MFDLPEDQLDNTNSKAPPQLRKYLFKKGVSGNPGGRPAGSVSMKTFAKNYLETMPEEDRIEFMNGLDPKVIWEMAEGKAKQDLDIQGELTSKIINVDE